MAIDLQITDLMGRIEGGELVALETKYHLECLTGFHNCHRSFKQVKECDESFEEESQGLLLNCFLTLKTA